MKKIFVILLITCFQLKTAEDEFIVISLGESCSVTAALEVFKLKQASYPFEWCIVNFEPLYNSLKNDFLDFTNQAYFTRYFDQRSIVNKYGIVMAHDFPVIPHGRNSNGEEMYRLSPEWENALPAIQAKYQRRLDRFYAACRSNKKIYFVRYLDVWPATAEQLSNLLTEKFPSLDFTLICVRNSPPNLGTWHINKVKNYYIDPNSPDGYVNEWKKIFIDAGIIKPTKSKATEEEIAAYKRSLCGHCPYCENLRMSCSERYE